MTVSTEAQLPSKPQKATSVSCKTNVAMAETSRGASGSVSSVDSLVDDEAEAPAEPQGPSPFGFLQYRLHLLSHALLTS